MPRLTLSDEQVDTVRGASGPVEVRDPEGNLLGFLNPSFTDRDRAEALRRLHSDGPWLTTRQVRDRLASLGDG